jgi:CheY-like chemotaxis protein
MSKDSSTQIRPETSAARSARTIVVVDDLADLREVTVMLLEYEGYKVLSAADGSSGLQLAVENDADLVLLDYLVPGMDGADVGLALRAHPKARRARIVIMSATPEKEIRKRFDDYDEFLKKPYPPADMLELIAFLLESEAPR